jgi:hypothetical protein
MSFSGQESGLQAGDIKLYVSKPDQVMTPAFWAREAAARIIMISEDAPQPIREQAKQFQQQIFRVILHNINQAIEERRARDAYLASKVGYDDLAAEIRGDCK